MLLLLFALVCSWLSPQRYPDTMAPLQVETTTDTSHLLPSSFLAYYDMKSIVGDIFGEYNCSWEKSNGTLYAGSKGIYFLGSFFLFERKLILEWEQVRLVQKADQGIDVVCKNEASHSFYGKQSPDRFWALLLSLHNDALLDLKRRRGSTNYRRRNSDPWSSPQHVHGLISESSSNEAGLPGPAAVADPVDTRASTNTVKATSLKQKSSADIETIVGWTQMDPVACKMDRTPGQLYAGENGLLFSGKRFFWETRSLAIRWEDIVRIKIVDHPQTSSTDPRSDTIEICGRDSQTTTFSSITNVRAVWASLVALHNEKLRKADSPRHRTHRRMNSDPLRESKAMIDIDCIELLEDSTRTETTETVETMEEQWERAKKEGQMKTIIVDNITLNCSLDRFVTLFVQDEADYSLSRYLEGRGDMSLKASRWKKVNDIESTRTISYTHPMNIPLAPPQADASKEQKYMRYGKYGLMIETKTIVRDVPMADCFYVADRLVVKPEGEGKVKLRMEFDITFIKSTMFKGIISKTTTSELTSYLNDFAGYISQSMGGESVPVVDEVVVVKQKSERIPVADSNHVLTICMVAIFSLQVWILYDLRSIKSSLRSLHR